MVFRQATMVFLVVHAGHSKTTPHKWAQAGHLKALQIWKKSCDSWKLPPLAVYAVSKMLRASRASPPAAVLSVAPHDPGSCQGALVGLYLGMPLRQVLHLLQRKLSKGRNILRARILHRPWQLLHLPARPPQQLETASFPDSKGSPGSPSSSASSYSQTMMARRQDSHLRFHCPDSDSDSDGGIQGDLDNEKEEDADADVFT